MPLNVMLVGSEAAAVRVLRNLVDDGHELVAVLVENPDTSGAGLVDGAGAAGVVVEPASLVTDPDFADEVRRRKVDVLLNVHSLSIMTSEVAEAPSIGSFNLHPGPLPRYSGLNVVTWAIAEGCTSHGVTLHWIEAGIDAGAIVEEVTFPVGANDTGLSVFSACITNGVEMVRRLMSVAATDPNGIAATPQTGERRMYRRAEKPAGGRIDWSQSASRVHDLARASNYGPFPSPTGHPVARYRGRRIEIIGTATTGLISDQPAGTISTLQGGEIVVATADEWLTLRTVADDGRPVPAHTVLEPGGIVENG